LVRPQIRAFRKRGKKKYRSVCTLGGKGTKKKNLQSAIGERAFKNEYVFLKKFTRPQGQKKRKEAHKKRGKTKQTKIGKRALSEERGFIPIFRERSHLQWRGGGMFGMRAGW